MTGSFSWLVEGAPEHMGNLQNVLDKQGENGTMVRNKMYAIAQFFAPLTVDCKRNGDPIENPATE